jgi:hypothetical protein
MTSRWHTPAQALLPLFIVACQELSPDEGGDGRHASRRPLKTAVRGSLPTLKAGMLAALALALWTAAPMQTTS